MNHPLAPAPLLAILRELAEAASRSTEQLAAAADVDSDAIHAAHEQLLAHGVTRIDTSTWSTAAPLDLLCPASISARLSATTRLPCRLRVLGVTGSTNDDARAELEGDAEPSARPDVVLAEAQDRGRGRRGRAWQSPVASNIYLTQIETLTGGPETARGLSLAVGVAVAEAIERLHGVDVELKWPNDLLVGGSKLGGILVELAMTQGRWSALLGVGVNVRVPDYVAREIDQAWVDLASLSRDPVSRNETAAAMIAGLRDMAAEFRVRGFDARLRSRWQARDPFYDRAVVVTSADGAIAGTARGIDDDGELLVDTPAGRRRIGAGEVSIRLAEPPR